MILRRRGAGGGFSLIEVIAALFVFSIVTLGIIPLLSASLRGSDLARSSNVAKSLAVQAMERARGLPYYVSYDSQQTKAGGGKIDADILDFYYPGAPNSGTAYVVTCDDNDDGRAECPDRIPPGYAVTFTSRFVAPDGTTAQSPPAGYNSNASTVDEPPTLLMDFSVRIDWSIGDRERDFTMRTLLGSRRFGRLMQGRATVEFGVQIQTNFDTGGAVTPQRTQLIALAGSAESRIEQRSTTTADQTVDTATVTLSEDPAGTLIDEVATSEVAEQILHAPGQTTVADTTGPGGVVSAPGIGDVAGVDRSVAGEPGPLGDLVVGVANELPEARGGFSFEAGGATQDVWVDNPQNRTTGRALDLQLNPTAKLVSVDLLDNTTDTNTTLESLRGYTRITTDDVFFGGVEADAVVEMESLRLFPTTFVTNTAYGGALLVIDEFRAQVTCNAFSRAGVGTTTAPITWSARVLYWRESAANDGVAAGSYQAVNISGTDSTDLLAALETANPKVYEAPDAAGGAAKDLFLFPSGSNLGFLENLTSTVNTTAGSVGDNGRSATAALDGAIRIGTVPVPAATGVEESPLTITVGSLSCESIDLR